MRKVVGELWIFNYKWRQDMISDLMAGATMAIIQIPQGQFFSNPHLLKINQTCPATMFDTPLLVHAAGMAYALLANCPPVMGIYTSIFPVLIYSILGPCGVASKGTATHRTFAFQQRHSKPSSAQLGW